VIFSCSRRGGYPNNMIPSPASKLFACSRVCFLATFMVIAGCSLRPEQVKEQADTDVYSIIDRKWDEKFGLKTNFRISDTTPVADAVRVDRAIGESGVLTLEHAVALATNHNRQYQTEREALYLKALDLRLVRHRYEPNIFGRGSGGLSRRGEDATAEAGADFGFEQLLATGARITTRVALGWVNILSGNISGGTGLAAVLGAAIEQPLLRGAGRAIALEELTQAERDTLYQIRTFNRFRKRLVVDVIGRYYRILQLKDALDNAEANYHTLARIHDRSETLTRAGTLPRHELQQAHQDRLEALDIYVRARKAYEQALDDFKIVLSLPTTTKMELDTDVLKTLVADGVPELDFGEDDAVKTALAVRLDLANVADMVLDAERKVAVAEDGLRAELNLTGVVQPGITDRAGFDSLTGGLQSDEDRYTLSAQLDLPLDRMAEKTAYRKSLINLIQRRRDYEETADRVVLEVRKAYRNLKEARDRYLVQSRSLALAKERADNTFLLLQYSSRGNRRANTRDVLDAQEDLFRAQNEATEALVDYNIALLEFYRDTGVLHVKPDGMWQKATAAK